jgi:hypothetical protein
LVLLGASVDARHQNSALFAQRVTKGDLSGLAHGKHGRAAFARPVSEPAPSDSAHLSTRIVGLEMSGGRRAGRRDSSSSSSEPPIAGCGSQ